MTQINSKSYWDNRFNTDWVSNFGREQSAFFATLAIEAFPYWLREEIKEKKLAVLDWGCALGDGTNVIKNSFPQNNISGIDFSTVAIGNAKKKYPTINFIAENILTKKKQKKYDVVFSSNTLEHFGEPWLVLQKLVDLSLSYTIILVPFKEYKRYGEHLYSFDETNIRLKVGNSFSLIHFKIINGADFSPSFWGELQVLLVYSRGKKIYEKKLKTISQGDILLIEKLNEQGIALNERERKMNKKIDEIKIDLNKYQAEYDKLNSFINEAKKDILELKLLSKEIVFVKNRFDEINILADKTNKRTENIFLEIGEVKEAVNEIENMKLYLRNMFDELKLAINEEQTSKFLENELNKNNEQMKYLRLEVEAFKNNEESVLKIKRELERSTEEIKSQKEEILKIEKEKAIVLYKLSEAEKKINELHTRIVFLEEESKSKNKEMDEYVAQQSQAMGKVKNELNQQKDINSKLVSEKQIQLNDFKKELDLKKSEISKYVFQHSQALEKMKSQLNQEKENDAKALFKKQNQLDDLKREFNKIRAEIGIKNLVEEQVAEKEKIIKNLEFEISEREKESNQTSKSVNELIIYTEKLEQIVQWYKNTYEKRSMWGILKEKTLKTGKKG